MIVILIFLCIAQIFGDPITSTKTPFSIEETALNELSEQSFSGKWISDVEIEYRDKETQDVKVFNVAENKTRVVLDNQIFESHQASHYSFSPNRKYVLFSCNITTSVPLYTLTQFVVYSLEDNSTYSVFNNKPLRTASWGPKNNSLIFIEGNNIYYMPEINPEMTAYNITTNGEHGIVYNGVCEPVYCVILYQDEFGQKLKTYWFSPKGDRLVYLTLYYNNVSTVSFLQFGEPGDINNQYVEKIDLRYPKTGSTNPDYELWLVFLDDPYKKKLITKSENGNTILHQVSWVDNDNFYYGQYNRVQNESKIYHCQIDFLDACELRFEETNEIGWVNNKIPLMDEDSQRILKIEYELVGDLDRFKHLILYHNNGTRISLTKGYAEVTKIIHWDKINKIVYYTAAEENDTISSQVYAVTETNNTEPVCLSCQIKTPEGRTCKVAEAYFNQLASYVYFDCMGPDPKVVYLYKNRLSLGSPLHVLEENSKLREQLRDKLFPEVMDFSVDIPGPFKADVRLLLPPNIDKNGKTKYPLLIYVYGGPFFKVIYNKFILDWNLYVTTNQSVIYGLIDGRNTDGRGEKMLYAGYRTLGTYELEDQLTVTKYIQEKYPFVDSKRTGIWGFSYGGYATTKILQLDTENVFKCGVAVSPVSDWLYYYTVYTERYMGLLQENKNNYERASLLNDVSNLRNKQYLLIHGTADDNVHYQNSMMITKVLQKENIPFELMIYPDEDHKLRNVMGHFAYTIDRFFKKCFQI